MNISQLLEALKSTEVNLTVGEKLTAGFGVAILSMVVVFIILAVIACIITLLQKEKKLEEQKLVETSYTLNNNKIDKNDKDLGELVSVITAAICAATGNSSNNIVVKKIVRSNNSKTSWESMKKK